MLQQEAMIERTRHVCREDERLVAAMMYGSFAQGEGDGFSDIEFILFFEDEELEDLDQEEWVSKISPVGLYFVNEYGNGTTVFENLLRGEFHFDCASEIERGRSPRAPMPGTWLAPPAWTGTSCRGRTSLPGSGGGN